MKKCTLILFLVISINLLGQETKNDSKKTVKYSIDSEVTIIYKDSLLSLSEEKSPIYLVDGIQVNNTKGLKYLNPENIKSVNVDKEKFTIEGKVYYGKVNIITKENYNPNFLTLKALAKRYLQLDSDPVIFQIDDEIINSEINQFVIDEQFVLIMEVSKVPITERDKINFVRIITKTQKNIKAANQITIRGS